MRFTVIIPLYNKAKYIVRALDSIVVQTYKDWSIIVIDDGSTDGGGEIVRAYQDKRILYHFQDNKGVSAARNKGVSLAASDYVTFLDADDTWENEYLAELDKLIKEYPQAGIFATNHFYVYSSGIRRHVNFDNIIGGNKHGLIKDYFEVFANYQKSPFSNSNCCYNRSQFLSIGGYREGVRLTEDSDLWCRYALSYPIAYSAVPLANYFFEVEGNTQQTPHLEDLQVTKTLKSLKTKKAIPEVYRKSVDRLIAVQQLSLVKRSLLNGNNSHALKKLFKSELIKNYPLKFFSFLFLGLIPGRLINTIYRYIRSNRVNI